MSGVEIAGIILGAYPIILEALDTYRDAWRKLEEWWEFKRTFEDFVDDVGIQLLIFEDNLEKLLAPFVDSDRQMGILLNNPQGPEWRSARMEEKLRSRLTRAYVPYMSLARRMKETLEDLSKLLGIDSDEALILWADRSPRQWKAELKRIRIAFSQQKFKQVEQLSKQNSDLRRLLQASDDLAPLRQKRKSNSLAAFLKAIQDQASSLHSALSQGWRCECKELHAAKLCLQSHTDYAKSPKKPLVVLFETQDQLRSPSWQETEVKIIEPPPAYTETAPPVEDRKQAPNTVQSMLELKQKIENHKSQKSLLKPVPKLPSKSPNGRSSPAQPPRSPSFNSAIPLRTTKTAPKKVGFQEEEVPPVYRPSISTEQSDTCIDDLCLVFGQFNVQDSKKCIGYLLDQQDRRHGLFATSNTFPFSSFTADAKDEAISKTKAVSLADLLGLSTQPKRNSVGATSQWPSLGLTKRARYNLALTIASSMLQLHSTPWLSGPVDKKHIYFPESPSPTSPIPKPYVSASFYSVKSEKAPSPPGSVQNAPLAGPATQTRAHLLSLGIILLELLFATPIEAKYSSYSIADPSKNETTSHHLSPQSPAWFANYLAADLWLNEVYEELGPEIMGAISLCVHCGVGPKVDLGNEEFVSGLWEGVIGPLGKLVSIWDTVV